MRLHGRIPYDSPSLDLGGYREKIKPGAFSKSLSRLSERPVFLVSSHDLKAHTSLASTDGRLLLRDGPDALSFSAQLPETSFAEHLYNLVENRDVTGVSFAFLINGADGESWHQDASGAIWRELKDLVLFEVSIVPLPAYPASRCWAGDEATGRARPRLTVVGGKRSAPPTGKVVRPTSPTFGRVDRPSKLDQARQKLQDMRIDSELLRQREQARKLRGPYRKAV
jgi:HK97 family phage prohead protease